MADSNKQYDRMVNSPVSKLIISLSIPTIISMMVTNVYNLVDTTFIGTLGTSASGAVGIVFGYMAILQAIGFMFGQGAGSIVARLLGNRHDEDASRIASTGFFYAFGLAIVVVLLSFIFLDPLVTLLGSTPTIAPYAKTYITFIMITAPFQVTGFTMNNILRYEGRALLGMIGLMTGAILNIAGDALLIFVFDLGIAGAGISTAVSQFVSFCILLYPFLKGKTTCKLSIRKVSRRFREVLDIAATGLPSLLRQGLNSITTILLNSQAAVYGDAAVAAMSIVARIFFFIFSVSIGVGQGFQPVGGYSYGAKKYDRLKKAYKFTFVFSEIMIFILGGIVFAFANSFVTLLRNDPAVIEIGTRALRIQCVAAIFLPFCMVTEMMMQCSGQRVAASLLSSVRSGLFFIPLLIILPAIRGLNGVEEAQPVSYVLGIIPAAILAARFFRKLNRLEEEQKQEAENLKDV